MEDVLSSFHSFIFLYVVFEAGDEEPFERLASRMVDISGDGGVLKMVSDVTQANKHGLFVLFLNW